MVNNHYLIIPASGVGMRMQSNIPKQYLKLENGLTIIEQTLKTLLSIEKISGCIIATGKKDTKFNESKFFNHPKIIKKVIGGKKRFNSVLSALEALKPIAKENDWVLVHDAVRPCIKTTQVIELINKLENHPVGGLLATPVTDTIKKAKNNIIKKTINRNNLFQAQTPQMYRFGVLLKALKTAIKDDINVTDEASAVENLGLKSVIVPTNKSNIKITNIEDLALANFYLKNSK